jgi:co-chaperonin GroES (HSP10)
MSDKKKNNDSFPLNDDALAAALDRVDPNTTRTIRNVSPLGMRVLVQICEKDDVTDGGLYIPDSARKNMAQSLIAEVLEVASAIDDETDEETNVSGIPQGATVLIDREAGTTVPWDDRLRIVDSKDILAIVDEIVIS